MLILVESTTLTPLIASAQQLLDRIQSGVMFSEELGDMAATVTAADRMQTAITSLSRTMAEDIRTSPFLTHREIILGHYSTAKRLQDLVLHLWNDGNPSRLASLFMNADETHTAIALELIVSYTRHGENDTDFMRLADEIRDMRKAEAARANTSELETA